MAIRPSHSQIWTPPQPPPAYVGVFSYVDTNHASETVPHIWESADGLAWTQRQIGFFSPSAAQSDCSITFWNGSYWMAYTRGGGTNNFGIATSSNGDYWTEIATPSTSSISGVVFTWAPEWFLDPADSTRSGVHIYVSCTTTDGSAMKQYELHPTNDAMTAWSNPAAITLAGGSPAWTNGMIDAFVAYHSGGYALWAKQETAIFGDTTTYLGYLTASSLTGTWTAQHGGSDWAGLGAGYEGACLVQVSGAHWRLYANKVNTPQIYYSDSLDDWATWSAFTAITALAAEGHGTIFKRPAGLMV